MKAIKIKSTWFSMMLTALLSLFAVACTSINEPTEQRSSDIDDPGRTTRSASSIQTLSETEAMEIAYDVLVIKDSEKATIQYATTQRQDLRDALGSEKIAYVINFPNSKRSIIIANVACSMPVIATGNQITNVKNGKIESSWFNGIENFVADLINSQQSGSDRDYKFKCLDCEHYFIRNPIKTNVHTGDPFNRKVLKEHPGCHAGSVPTACATVVEYTDTCITYKNVEYNFPKIKDCLEKGPDLIQGGGLGANTLNVIDKDIPTIGDVTLKFLGTYDGAVSATNYLISAFGNGMYTSYAKDNSTTYLSDAYRLLKEIGFELSDFRSKFDRQHVWELLFQDYLVIQEVIEIDTNKKSCCIITGGENLSSDRMDATGVLFFVYSVENPKEHYSFTFDYLNYRYDLKQYFGIKIKK